MNKQLDEMWEPTEDDIWRDTQITIDENYAQDHLGVGETMRRSMRKYEREQQVVEAAERCDFHALAVLTANDPELRHLAVRVFKHGRDAAKSERRSGGRGRMKGERRPSDLLPVQKLVLQDALADIVYMREIMQREFGRWYGSTSICTEIAAERARVDVDLLIKFQKHQKHHT